MSTLQFRDDLVCLSTSDSQSLLRFWMPSKEMYCSLIPLLRFILETEYVRISQMLPKHHQYTHASSLNSVMRKKLENIFVNRNKNADSTSDSDRVEDVSIGNINVETLTLPTRTAEMDGILLIDDIEEF